MAVRSGRLMNPVGLNTAPRDPIAPRLDRLDGKVIGLLDNSKKNADLLLKAIGALLSSEHHVAGIVYHRKVGSSPAAPAAMLDDLAARCDAVINAYGDCGSCTSWCVHDGVTLERRGIPTATVNSDAFVVLGQQEAIALGLPGLPIVTVPHPMGDVAADVVQERARAMLAQVLAVLTTDAETLESQYTDRFITGADAFVRAGMVCEI